MVAVRPNGAKKPDLTGLLNTSGVGLVQTIDWSCVTSLFHSLKPKCEKTRLVVWSFAVESG